MNSTPLVDPTSPDSGNISTLSTVSNSNASHRCTSAIDPPATVHQHAAPPIAELHSVSTDLQSSVLRRHTVSLQRDLDDIATSLYLSTLYDHDPSPPRWVTMETQDDMDAVNCPSTGSLPHEIPLRENHVLPLTVAPSLSHPPLHARGDDQSSADSFGSSNRSSHDYGSGPDVPSPHSDRSNGTWATAEEPTHPPPSERPSIDLLSLEGAVTPRRPTACLASTLPRYLFPAVAVPVHFLPRPTAPVPINTPAHRTTVGRPLYTAPPYYEVPPDLRLQPDEAYILHRTTHSTTLRPLIIQASFDGVAHPFLRGYTGPNRSTQRSFKPYYVVRRGWSPGIFTSWASAWARVIDFKQHTGQAADFASSDTLGHAIEFLGWDPRYQRPSTPGPLPPSLCVLCLFGPYPRPYLRPSAPPVDAPSVAVSIPSYMAQPSPDFDTLCHQLAQAARDPSAVSPSSGMSALLSSLRGPASGPSPSPSPPSPLPSGSDGVVRGVSPPPSTSVPTHSPSVTAARTSGETSESKLRREQKVVP